MTRDFMPVDKSELRRNLDSLKTTIEMALAIDEGLKSEIEKAGALRKQIIAERSERNKIPLTPPHRFVP